MNLIAASSESAKSAIVALIIVCIIAAVVFFGCSAAGRRDLAGIGAAIVLILGGLFVLLDYA